MMLKRMRELFLVKLILIVFIDGKLSMTELFKKTNISYNTIYKTILLLEKNKITEKSSCDDNRLYIPKLTAKGEKMKEHILYLYSEYFK